MQPKIVFSLLSFHAGGTEWFTLRLARALARKGFQPQLLTHSDEGSLAPLIRDEFTPVTLQKGSYEVWDIFRAVPRMIRFLRTEKPDVLISGLPLLNAMNALSIALARVSTRLITIEHMRLAPDTGSSKTKVRVKAALIRLTHLVSDAVVCVSQTVALDLEKAMRPFSSARRSSIIYNPVIPETLDELMAQPLSVPLPFSATHAPVLVSVGRLLPVKNHGLLLAAFQLVLQAKPDAQLVLIGEGAPQARAELDSLILAKGLAGHVTLTGAVHNVFPFLKRADLFVLSSRQEAFGNVLVEALACGTKVVSTDCGGPREILENGKYGRLVPNDDAQALATAILDELETRRDPAFLQERGRSFSVARATEAYAALITNLLAAR